MTASRAFDGRDPRRCFTEVQRAEIAIRQRYQCAYCACELVDGEWDAHHIIWWEDGGRTEVDNGLGLCRPCHKLAERVYPDFTPRDWQQRAKQPILEPLMAGRFATLNVAPGGGKTRFSGWIAKTMLERGLIDRVGIAVPYRPLCDQWCEALSHYYGIYLTNNEARERRGQHGVVITYQSFRHRQDVLLEDVAAPRTLWILDEVHHLSVTSTREASAWAIAVERVVGNITHPYLPVLNLTGTLFRSKATEQIPTVDYRMPEPGVLESVADFTISAAELIADRVLRGLRVLGFDQDMSVRGIVLAEEASPDAMSVRAVDLDAFRRRDRNRVFQSMIRNLHYIDGMIGETIKQLEEAAITLGSSAPTKGLVIADDVEHARQIHARLVELGYGDVTFIAVSEDNDADDNIKLFRKQPKPAILVAVQKVTEGFDVPDVAVLTYLNSWCAPLFINQMVGRAMRVTVRERELGFTLPATILIPDERQIREAFADVLVGAMRMLEAPAEPCVRCGKLQCTCPLWAREKQCTKCQYPWFLCVCQCIWCRERKPQCVCPKWMCKRCGQMECDCPPIEQLVELEVEILQNPELTSSNVNGHQIRDMQLREAIRAGLIANGLSPIQADACAATLETVQTTMRWSMNERKEDDE